MKKPNPIRITAILLLALFSFQLPAEQKNGLSEGAINNLKVLFSKPTDEQQAAQLLAAQWRNGLNEHLLKADDEFSQIMALASILSGIQQAKLMAEMHEDKVQQFNLTNFNYQPYAAVLNQMVDLTEISSPALNIMTKVCHEVEIAKQCKTHDLLEKRMLLDGDNLQSYLRPFAIASQLNNPILMSQLIQFMSKTTHSTTPLNLTPHMLGLIDTYMENNPSPPAVIENQINEYKRMTGISEDMKTRLPAEMPNHMSTMVKISYQFLTDVPPYKPFLEFCKKTPKAADSCRNIAEIMIQKSNTMIDKGMGHAVLIASYEAEKDQAGIVAAEQLNKNFRSSYECIRKLVQPKYFIDDYFDPEYQLIHSQVSDEYERLIQLAERNYKKSVSNGQKDATNPDSCFVKSNVN